MNSKKPQFIWEAGGKDRKGFVPLISQTLGWRQRTIPKYKQIMWFEISDGSDVSNVLGHFKVMALEMALNVYVQVTDSPHKEVGLRHLKLGS